MREEIELNIEICGLFYRLNLAELGQQRMSKGDPVGRENEKNIQEVELSWTGLLKERMQTVIQQQREHRVKGAGFSRGERVYSHHFLETYQS